MRGAEPVTIRIGTILPTGTPQHQLLMALFEQWRKDSDGTVKVILYPDGRLGGESEMVKKMRIKQLGGGVLTTVGLAEVDRGVAGLQLMPMGFHSWAEVDYVREKLRPMLEERLHAKGYEVLFWADAGWVRFFSKEAAVRPSDFQKMKLFTWSGDVQQAELMRSAGYRPVALETTDILLGLNTDMINAIPVPPIIALAGQFYGPAPHMLELNWSPIVGATVVRTDLWEKIPAELRTKLRASAEATGEKIRAQSRQENDAAVKAMQERGLKVHTVPPDAAGEWKVFADTVTPKVRGALVPEEVFDAVQKYLAEFRQKSGSTP
jgi:TRAP-type C4-dicarboxylate transport system substrate-binding protein